MLSTRPRWHLETLKIEKSSQSAALENYCIQYEAMSLMQATNHRMSGSYYVCQRGTENRLQIR